MIREYPEKYTVDIAEQKFNNCIFKYFVFIHIIAMYIIRCTISAQDGMK